MAKKNILFILPYLPYPLKSGGHQAIFNGIKAFINDANISIFFEEPWDNDYSKEQEAFVKTTDNKVKVFKYKQKNETKKESLISRTIIKCWKIKESIKNLFRKKNKKPDLPYLAIQTKSPDTIHFVNEIIEKEHIDIVQCETLATITHILTLPKKVRTLFVHHEIGFIRQKQEIESGLFSESSKKIQSDNQKNEIFLLNKFDDIITLSNHDSQILQSLRIDSKIYTSIATINLNDENHLGMPDCNKLSFVGPSWHSPNVIGIHWFLDNCWNRLKKHNPNYTLQIIGDWSKEEIQKIKSNYPDIEFKGFVENLSKTISNTIMIVPITVGSGIRMKILEAIYIGCPVVSTTIGAQGLPLIDEEDCLISDEPSEFVSKIICLQNVDKISQLAIHAKEKIKANYSIEKLYSSRIKLYK